MNKSYKKIHKLRVIIIEINKINTSFFHYQFFKIEAVLNNMIFLFYL